MKQKITVLVVLFMSSYPGHYLFAQADTAGKNKPEFKLNLIYNSSLNYYGRTDSLKSTGFFPLAEFWVTPSFYVNAAPVFINNSLQTFDYVGTIATIGYLHTTEKWMTGINVVKPFYEPGSAMLQSALKAQLNFSVTRLNKVANITIATDAKFSDQTDFGATVGIDHLIKIPGKKGSVWVLDPSFNIFAGTQQFSRTYTKQQSSQLLFPGTTSQQKKTYTQFNILAYEISGQVVFAKGKMLWFTTPSYVIPKNLYTDTDSPELSERGANTFYTMIGIKYRF